MFLTSLPGGAKIDKQPKDSSKCRQVWAAPLGSFKLNVDIGKEQFCFLFCFPDKLCSDTNHMRGRPKRIQVDSEEVQFGYNEESGLVTLDLRAPEAELYLWNLTRVLDFEDAPIDYVPEGVGNLFHLHYLSLKNTKVKVLPKTVGKLLNLETLNLKKTLVGELPIEIKNLKRLRYLVIKRSDSPILSYGEGTNIQEGFGSLIDLQKLDGIQLNSKMLDELKKLRQLRILGVQLINGNGKDIESVASPPKYLEGLYLSGNLKKLPNWIFNLQNLVQVFLARSDFTDDPMRVLHSLPNLLKLELSEAYNGEQLHIKQGWFPKLLKLSLCDLKGLKFIMIEDGAMSLLKNLMISACPLLKVIPSGVENLRNLSYLQFHNMLMEIEPNSTFLTYETLERLKHIPIALVSCYDKEEKLIAMHLKDIWHLQCKYAEALPEKEGEASSS
ncbi:hypothetical protein LWI28_015627 [Acer negundo]|uniref:Disease resistance R13L4/SHOC-2-like LRR domain-containing protein n=1 Tax=Acer negundo TaxID=4023 RepID=A0AAD5NXG5_ACENE|nr:hypothetical protein LWI28_015627 [Acer negundo]